MSTDCPEKESTIRFVPHSSAVEVGFWHALASRKLNDWKLDRGSVALVAERRPARVGDSGGAGTNSFTELPGACLEDAVPVEAEYIAAAAPASSRGASAAKPRRGCYHVPCVLTNFNTVEDFKGAERSSLAKAHAARLLSVAAAGTALDADAARALISGCILHTFADIKKWRFMHWFCFPAVVPRAPLTGVVHADAASVVGGGVVAAAAASYDNAPRVVFAVVARPGGEGADVVDLDGLDALLRRADGGSDSGAAPGPGPSPARVAPGGDVVLAFADHSALAENPGSSLRNIVALVAARYGCREVRALALRSGGAAVVVDVCVPDGAYDFDGQPNASGWEANARGKAGPRLVDLGGAMDPVSLAEGSVDLNLKLMRWRLMPTLDLEAIAAQRCLLLGSGTLGCNVARALLGWGVREITFVDNGRVSYSNPVRQSLFTHADCADGGRHKAVAAAERLSEIFPSARARGVVLTIPMAGHPIGADGAQHDAARADHDALRDLIAEHDVVFLLTDSRESRWLPTLIARSLGKPMINAALGFDSYVIMRHGVDGGDTRGHGCYFCNDVAAPVDSLSNRSLDQQCTVTRPGVSMIAAAYAVELAVAVINHPDGWLAAGDTALQTSERAEHPLGVVPQQVRGFLTHVSNVLVSTVRSKCCTACSPIVVQAYQERGFDVVTRACNEDKYLEDLTGLTQLYAEAEAAFAAIEALDDDNGELSGDDW